MNFALIYKIIKKALAEAESNALEQNVDVTTPGYFAAVKALRDKILSQMGTTPEEYDAYLESLKEVSRSKREAKQAELDTRLNTLETTLSLKIEAIPSPTYEALPDKPTIPTPQEISTMIATAIKAIPPIAPVIKVEKPVIEQTIIKEQYDPTKLWIEMGVILKKLEAVPPPLDVEKFKEELNQNIEEEVGYNLNKAIDILGMPDFRKLAMGLRQDIDALSNKPSGNNSTAVYEETPAGSGTAFTIVHTPVAGTVRLFRGGARQQTGTDYTISGKNITLTLTLSTGEVLLADYNY